jgi:hypothetical protein
LIVFSLSTKRGKAHSVSVKSEWNKNWNLIGEASIREFTNERKTAKVVAYEFRDEFSQMVEAMGFNPERISPPSQRNEGDEGRLGGVSELLAARAQEPCGIAAHSRGD